MRETSLRQAFASAVRRVIDSPRPVRQPGLVKRIARKVDAGVGVMQRWR